MLGSLTKVLVDLTKREGRRYLRRNVQTAVV